MNGRHTPGPWMFGKDSHEILTARGQGVASPCEGYDEEQWLIDGPLIAAVPDLLAACEQAEDFISEPVHSPYGDGDRRGKQRRALAKLRAAIEKARKKVSAQ